MFLIIIKDHYKINDQIQYQNIPYKKTTEMDRLVITKLPTTIVEQTHIQKAMTNHVLTAALTFNLLFPHGKAHRSGILPK